MQDTFDIELKEGGKKSLLTLSCTYKFLLEYERIRTQGEGIYAVITRMTQGNVMLSDLANVILAGSRAYNRLDTRRNFDSVAKSIYDTGVNDVAMKLLEYLVLVVSPEKEDLENNQVLSESEKKN